MGFFSKGEILGRLKRGWTPIWFGAVLGLLIGFGGGAGAAYWSNLRGQAAPLALDMTSILPTPTPTPTPVTTLEPTPSPTAHAVSRSSAASSGPAQPSATCGSPSGKLVRFRVAIDKGLATTPSKFVADLLSVLCDKRSWIASGEVRFRYDPSGPLLIGLRTPSNAESRCMKIVHLSVHSYYSCGSSYEVVLNSDRWFKGSDYWPGPVAEYRRMLVNHEVGHAIGQHHRTCPSDGAPAPVMMQQSKGLTTNGNTCKPNPWPLSYELASVD